MGERKRRLKLGLSVSCTIVVKYAKIVCAAAAAAERRENLLRVLSLISIESRVREEGETKME